MYVLENCEETGIFIAPQLGSTLIEGSLVNRDVIIGAEDEGDEFDHDEFTSIKDEDDVLELISDVEAYNDDDDD
ncbi:hypothetical protein V6N13_001781 [Hibiscus sabdariffa]|uniref:Uncharacterized protein n=1 Tax=Hibiscus sabdariffa TaxID=183260 RepID=A0ABR2G9R9_9ROSI